MGLVLVKITFQEAIIKTEGVMTKNINKQTEILSLIENLSYKENHHYLHIHGVLANSRFQTSEGHFEKSYYFPQLVQ